MQDFGLRLDVLAGIVWQFNAGDGEHGKWTALREFAMTQGPLGIPPATIRLVSYDDAQYLAEWLIAEARWQNGETVAALNVAMSKPGAVDPRVVAAAATAGYIGAQVGLPVETVGRLAQQLAEAITESEVQ